MMSSLAFALVVLAAAVAITLMSAAMCMIAAVSRRQDQATTLSGFVIAMLVLDWLISGDWHRAEFGKNMLHLSAMLVFEYQCFCNIIRRYRHMSTVTKPPIRPKPKPIPGQE